MKKLILILLLGIGFNASANDISKINKLKKSAEVAFKAGRYQEAVENYAQLIDSLQIDDEQAILNYGHAYYQLGEKELAQSQYQKLVLSDDPALKSIAYQQLGALSNDPKMLEKALSYFKESIKSDPTNQDARYNYELVKKKLKEQQEQNQDQQQNQDNQDQQENKDQENKDQENKDQQNQDQQNQEDQQNQDQQDQQNEEGDEDQEKQQQEGQENEQKEGDEQPQQKPQPEEGQEGDEKENDQQPMPSPSDKLKEINISEEKARMILEALKNSEIQYIQQNRRKPTKRKDSDKPDW